MQGTEHSGLVLVIEDDASIRLLIREMLRPSGFATVEAADGDSGVLAAREHLPDAILLDIGLPGVDGLTVLGRLKDDPVLAPIPVIMVTAWVEPEYVEGALRAGAHDYVRKPFDMAQLTSRVERAVRVGAREVALRAAAGRFGSVESPVPPKA